MSKINIFGVLYVIVISIIVWFLLWFAYDVIKIWEVLNPLTFTNLAVAICLIVFLAFGGIKQLKKAIGKT